MFDVSAALELTAERSDNVLAASSGAASDTLTIARPTFSLGTDWGLTAVQLAASASLGRHASFDSEDFDDTSVALRARRALPNQFQVRASLRSVSGHDSRRDPTDEDGLRPNEYQADLAEIGVAGPIGSIEFDFSARTRDIDYDDTPAAVGVINNDDRDRRENELTLRAGAAARGALQPFVILYSDRRITTSPSTTTALHGRRRVPASASV